ncbi:hypothetical protein BaRGS_00024525 [Batillaria attramentaria]|uniref:Uncharacterized protein n=1 Tax=Batillaria attramentaria TaxID=370345 RepID=A0ABD0KAZ3_9CAEN
MGLWCDAHSKILVELLVGMRPWLWDWGWDSDCDAHSKILVELERALGCDACNKILVESVGPEGTARPKGKGDKQPDCMKPPTRILPAKVNDS